MAIQLARNGYKIVGLWCTFIAGERNGGLVSRPLRRFNKQSGAFLRIGC